LAGVVVESTYNWYWLVDALEEDGHRVHLANTAAIKRYEGLKHSGDEDYAAYLARLLRLEILPCGYICPPAADAVRDLARKRMQLVRSRKAQVLSVENMLSRLTGAGMRSYAVQRLTLPLSVLPHGAGHAGQSGLRARRASEKALTEKDARTQRKAKPNRTTKDTPLPGIIPLLCSLFQFQRFR
jgi:transposase